METNGGATGGATGARGLRRPLVSWTMALMVGIAAGHFKMSGLFDSWLGQPVILASFALFLLISGEVLAGLPRDGGRAALAGSRRAGRRSAIVALILFFALGVLLSAGQELRLREQGRMAGETVELEGRVLSVREKDYGCEVVTAGGRGGCRVLLRLYGEEGSMGDLTGRRIRFRGKASLPEGRRNPACFDYALYLKTQRIGLIVEGTKAGAELVPGRPDRLLHGAWRAKRLLRGRLEKTMGPEEVELFFAMLFGEQEGLPDQLSECFRRNGTAHVMAVSGLHVGMVYGLLFILCGRRRGIVATAAVGAALVCYGALSGFSPSAVRAILMIFLHMGATLTHRKYDMSSAGAASAILMLAVNPLLLFHSGFQLSFLAVFALSVPAARGRRLEDLLRKRLAWTAGWVRGGVEAAVRGLMPLLVLQAVLAPVTANLFNTWSFSIFLLNAPVLCLAGMLVPMGIVLLLLCTAISGLSAAGSAGEGAAALVEAAFQLLAKGAEALLLVMEGINRALYLPGVTAKWVTSPGAGLIALYLALLFFLSCEGFQILCRKGRRRTAAGVTALLAAAALTVSVCAPQAMGYGRPGPLPELVFVDVGQGDCLHIRTRSGKNILIDGGGSRRYLVGKKILLPYLLKNGVKRIDAAFVTHLHEDHFQGIVELAREIPVDRLYLYEANRLRADKVSEDCGIPEDHFGYLCAGDRVRVDEEVEIQVLYPEAATREAYSEMITDDADENRSSLLLRVKVGEASVLMTGDLGFPGETQVLQAYGAKPEVLRSDVLKVGHHGSRYSTGDEFLRAVSPQIAVFQVGKNNFGHPHPHVIEKCRRSGIIVMRNDQQGAVMLTREGNGAFRAESVISAGEAGS